MKSGLDRDDYQFYGTLTLDSECLDLNFTHRSAHGSTGDEVVHGKYEKQAKAVIEKLKSKFPTVFSEPVFPIDRGPEINKLFEHEINLDPVDAPPPKKRLYPLDNVELEELKK